MIIDNTPIKKGMSTGNNDRFLRKWSEVGEDSLNQKWFRYKKGGGYRKWYGNQDTVLDWKNDGENLKQTKNSVLRNQKFYFK